MPLEPPKKGRASLSRLGAQPRRVQHQGSRERGRVDRLADSGELGNPLRFELTAGQRHDITQAEALIIDFKAEHVIGDKGYDSTDLLQSILDRGAVPVIPPRSNLKTMRDYDKYLYRERHLVECFINKIKHYRRIFSRFEKLSMRYLGFLSFVGTLVWLR